MGRTGTHRTAQAARAAQAALIAAALAVTACGRIAFDPVGAAGDASGDTGQPGSGDAPAGRSCTSLPPICGPDGTSDCCGSPLVPGGTFLRGYDVGSDGAYPDMTNPATVSDFRLDTYPVTVNRFRQFVNAGMGTQVHPPPAGAGARTLGGVANQGGWDPTWNASLVTDTAALTAALKCSAAYQTWTDSPGANEALPIACITWYEAFAFCVWDGGFLPTDAEWNYAASGGSEQRAFPWSNPPSSLAIDCSYANYEASGGYCVSPPNGAPNRVGSESPKGDGRYGQADLAGNASQWVLDWYHTPYVTPCTDCADLAVSTMRVFRDGGFFFDVTSQRVAPRFAVQPGTRDGGVRCARAP